MVANGRGLLSGARCTVYTVKGLLNRLFGWLFSFIWKDDGMGTSPPCKECRHAYESHYPFDVKSFDDPQAKRPCHHVGGCACPNYVPDYGRAAA